MSPANLTRDDRNYVASGRRRFRVTVENPGTPTPDGDGQSTTPPVVSPIPWDVAIDRVPAGDQEATGAGTVTATITHTLIGPWRADVSTRSAFWLNGRRLNCTGVRNMGERNITLTCTCVEMETATP